MAAALPTDGDPYSHLSTDDLKEELAVQQTILSSLIEDGPQDDSIQTDIAQARKAISRLKRHLAKSRDTNKSSTSAATMNAWNPSDAYTGPSRLGSHTPAGFPTYASSSSLSQRKRHWHPYLEDDDSSGPRTKSYRTTPSPLPTTTTTPSAAADDFFIDDDALIDLTGDDDDIQQLMRQQKAEFARLEQQKEDEKLARNLSQQFQEASPSPLLAPPTAPSSSGPTAFDRILGRSSQIGGLQGSTSSSQQNAVAGPSNSRVNSYTMPGSFDPDDDFEDSLEIFNSFPSNNTMTGNISSSNRFSNSVTIPQIGQWPPSMSSSSFTSGMGYAPNLPAVEYARQATMAQQGNHMPSSSSGPFSRYTDAPGFSSTGYRPGFMNLPSYSPSHNWGDGYSTAHSTGGGSLSDIINQTNGIDWNNNLDALGRPLSDRLMSYYDDLQDDPRKTAEEIRDLLANIRPDEDIPEEDRMGTPDALRYPLYPHQQLALQWMVSSEEGKNKGGILADDMGLGKTISTLSLMVTRPSSDRIKTNLIVGPVALIKQWETEIKKKVKSTHALSVLLMHGKTATYEELRKFDVVLTSYGKLGFEEKRYERWIEHHPGADPMNDADLAKSCPLIHPKSKFYRVILDEAQCIKNVNTLQARAASKLHSTHRWCLTGTPMMNGIHELYSLIKFLKIAPYHNQKEFTKTFGSLSPRSGRAARTSGENTRSKAMSALRVLLKAIMLRRMKTSKLDGKPLLNLPGKTDETAHVSFSEDEQSFYSNLEARTRITFNKYLRAGTVGKNYSNILVLLLRLRQACCHPHLNLDVEYVGNSEVTGEDMTSLAKSLAPEVVARLKAANEEGFNCPICLDAVIDPTIVLPCGHSTCGECFATLIAGAAEQNLRAGDEGGGFRCPECRGTVNPKNIINLTAFKAVHMPEPVADIDDEDMEAAPQASQTKNEDDESSDSDLDDEDDDDDEIDRNGNLKDFIVDDEEEVSDVKNEDGQEDSVPSTSRSKKSKKGKARSKKTDVKGKGKVKKEEVKPHMLKTLRNEAKKHKGEYKRYMKYLKKNWLPSAKVTECCRILQTIQESGDKTIVFSQFTFLLDLLEIPIKYELGIKYCRYDGGMTRQQRDAAAQDFQDSNSRTKIMLISLKAGNAGLNLTAANHVVIMDPFWNPYIENQAVDRAHRIGQQKPVKVHRLLVKETVEDRIIALQEQKRQFVDAALDEGESKQLGRLSLQDLQYLFNGRD